MSAYLKALDLHIYLVTTKKSYLGNDKYLEANTQALHALRQTLSKQYLSLLSHCDSAFAVWNTLISLKEQPSNYLGKEPIVDESDEACYMVQGIDSLEVKSDTYLDVCASSPDDHDSSIDAHALKEELSICCENLLSKYKFLKKKSFDLKRENENLFSKLDLVLKEKIEVSNERDVGPKALHSNFDDD